MVRAYLGDSYDAVKRMWADILRPWAPLYANPTYIPRDLREEFTLLTGIPMLPATQSPYSILNDPDTGIKASAKAGQKPSEAHITLDVIAEQLKVRAVRCVVTYDQAFARCGKERRKMLYQQKLRALPPGGCGFYYDSHAPFLFVAASPQTLQELMDTLLAAGIPEKRLVALPARLGGRGQVLPFDIQAGESR